MNSLRVAWRNLGRNGKRTAITFLAMCMSTAILIVSYSLMLGMLVDMEHSVTDLSLGEVQVHHPDYRAERSLYDTIDAPEKVLSAARAAEVSAAPRAFGFGLISRGSKSSGAQFWGVSPLAERETADLHGYLMKGEFLPDSPGKKVVLGRKLARVLDASPGSEVVVVVQASDGSIGNELLTVAGILKSVGESHDRSLALIHQEDFGELFAFPGKYHEIALNSRGRLSPRQVASLVEPAAGKSEVRTWQQLLPSLARMLDAVGASMLIMAAFFFLAAGLGVLNTMLMATFERIPEFGLVKALGASPWRILREIAAEALLLGLGSSIFGGVMGVLVAMYFEHYPIDLTAFAEGFTTSGIAFSALWRAELTAEAVYMPVLVMWLVAVLAALYPAAKAARLDPVKALTHV